MSNKLPYHIGISNSHINGAKIALIPGDPGQERYDTVSCYVHRRFKGSLEEWQSLGVLNYEMEAGTLFTMAGE
jgi:uridine phosphorylase